MTDGNLEAAGLIDLTDQVQDNAEAVGFNGCGCCLPLTVLILAAIILTKFLA
jgi:hypothetical protein